MLPQERRLCQESSAAASTRRPAGRTSIRQSYPALVETYGGVALENEAGYHSLQGYPHVKSHVPSQNASLAPNCKTRGSPAEVMEPNPGVPSTALGAFRAGVFVRLKTSVRNSKFT